MAKERNNVAPDQRPITELQAKRLAALSGLNQKELVNLSVVQISERFKWKIDLELLRFRRICGRVVKKDPVTGIEYPVPFATVHVEDTDCNFLGFSTVESRWAWYFPTFCRREEVATVVTDACGKFCVHIPRWEIDWILRFRKQRVCFPDIFIKPSVRDLLERLEFLPNKWSVIRPPKPEPDPAPFLLRDGGLTFRRTTEVLGSKVAKKLASFESVSTKGDRSRVNFMRQRQLLDTPAFGSSETAPLPPLPAQIRKLNARTKPEEVQALAREFKVDPKHLAKLNPRRFVGPFFRCKDMWVANWVPILDVPDITFRVTQDVDGDGDQETIYSENFFDVRWNSGSIPDITLEASSIAVASPILTCGSPAINCDVLGVVMAGLMPVVDPSYVNPATGYAIRPNQPHPLGDMTDRADDPPATAPFAGTLQLYGCNQVAGASFYRMRYIYQNPETLTDSPVTPFLNLSWQVWTGGALTPTPVIPDADGWYPILNPADVYPAKLLLNWPTGARGLYKIDMQVADAAKTILPVVSPTVSIYVDNSPPSGLFTDLAWRKVGETLWKNLETICPVVFRPKGEDIEFRVGYEASAQHFRSVTIGGGGCGDGNAPQRVLEGPNWSDPASPVNPYGHWYTDATDNSESRRAIFKLAGTAKQGAYSFNLAVVGRAFNPAGGDGGFDPGDPGWTPDLIWNYNPDYSVYHSALPVAVVDDI